MPFTEPSSLNHFATSFTNCPNGWHDSLYKGACGGWKCEVNDYIYGTKCAPIQDISCFKPDELNAWLGVCTQPVFIGAPAAVPSTLS